MWLFISRAGFPHSAWRRHMFSLSWVAGSLDVWSRLDLLHGSKIVALIVSLEYYPHYIWGTCVSKVSLVFHSGLSSWENGKGNLTASWVLLFIKWYYEGLRRSFAAGDVLLYYSTDFQCNCFLIMLLEWISDILVWSEHNPEATCSVFGLETFPNQSEPHFFLLLVHTISLWLGVSQWSICLPHFCPWSVSMSGSRRLWGP